MSVLFTGRGPIVRFLLGPAGPHRQRTRLAAVEPAYGTVIKLTRLLWRAQGLKFTVTGVENVPVTGGAVVGPGATLGAGNALDRGMRLFPGVELPDGAVRF